jgi:crossover junction endodeoxyribonuclease RuvC
MAGLAVAQYPPNLVKKSVVGAGHATKEQVEVMVRMLLPGCQIVGTDAADALAVAICHAHHRQTLARWRDAAQPTRSGLGGIEA